MKGYGHRIIWTPEQIKKVVQLWENKTSGEIAEEIGHPKKAVVMMATKIRQAGYPLKKKHNPGTLQNLIREALDI